MDDLICVTGHDYQKLLEVLSGLGVAVNGEYRYGNPTAFFITKDKSIDFVQYGYRFGYNSSVRKWLNNNSDKVFYIEGGVDG